MTNRSRPARGGWLSPVALATGGAMLVAALAGWAAKPAKLKPAATPAAEKLDYNRDIRPILSDKCFHCHGADPKALQAGLRLDDPACAVAKLPSGGRAIVPGKPASSELVQRINAAGPLRMPPTDSHKKLTAEERRILTRWVVEGARYKAHWAFVRPVRPALPVVRDTRWAKNGIDRFILARLQREGMKPSPQADRAALIRRVSLDLTGIPPTPAEVDAFVSDRSPNAYEKVVDRLLASPAYGERMAMDWLDGARYADSNGYQADWERYQWRWRDWVINAYNRNMPFDRFTIEQLAGDMLPHPTLNQRIATGFNRNHRINTEGGVIAEEWRVETVVDRVETTSQVWLGLTMGCARCHDHKYDPISQKEFYRFYAFFNNVSETGSGEERPVNHPPFIKAPTPEQEARLAVLAGQLKQQDEALEQRAAGHRTESEAWKLADLKDESTPLAQTALARYAFWPQSAATAGAPPAPQANGAVKYEIGRATGAVVTDGAAYVDLGNVGDFDTHESFSYGAWVNPANGAGSPLSRMDKSADFRGWDIYLAGSRPMVHVINRWPQNALKITAKATIPNGEWSHIFFTYDGTAKPDGAKLYINGEPVPVDVEANSLTETIRTPVTAKVGTRTGSDGYTGKVDDVAIFHRVLKPEEVALLAHPDPARPLLSVPPDQRTAEQRAELVRLWSSRVDPEYRKLAEARAATVKERDTLDGQVSSVMIMDELPKPRECFVLERGQYDKHGEAVTAGVPAVFPNLPRGAAANRLALARWIMDPANPLTARVAVNRYWEKFFGTGLVATSEDFGTRADFPSHPELLDWLATEFVRLKWDMKALQKEIVMSATYRQSSRVTPELLARDPANRLLARGPRFRLPAELIRDQALAAAGLLKPGIGGPSVRPYEPDGLWDETSVYGNLHNYMHDKGDGLYRRSLYTIWKRTAAPPNMTLFDAPTRETCRVRRFRTNTPLQALVTLNETTFVEAARVLGQQMAASGGPTPEARIVYGFRRMVGRRPTAKELGVLAAGLRRHLTRFRNDADGAKKLMAVGDAPPVKDLPAAEGAAYTLTAAVIMNMDEAVTKE